ncbi:hypothetical protein SAE02_33920 [Skermanella aerolata]|uniref:Uncharacterized protein n=1 Tax=Skermanella aerolata TaxID=393310 RepID=A0A512DRZ6_9PROT|nr:hypothetical protein [Skermanella aerolata]KJB94282.1 hypothetical protein N826_12665 [Skermanella aerolata KACC 11604]GEO39244.1 hypothetical protein SAE02_33920 [Skermanella aerolata]
MSDQGSRAATGEEEFIRVVDTSGELMGEFPSSRIAREFARRMIEARKASTLIVEWSKHGRRGQLAITRRTVDAADRRLQELKHQNERRARRWANLISGIAVAVIGMLALLNVAGAYLEARQVRPGQSVVQTRTGG